MNDFTKDELETIKNRLIKTQLLDFDPLVNKVKTLIDNYCEHKFFLNGCGEQAFAQCCKCGSISRVERI